MVYRKKCLVVFNLLLFGFSPLAGIEINGYYENDLVGGIKKDGGSFWGDLNRLRLRINAKLRKNIVLHFEPEFDLLFKSQDIPLIVTPGLNQLIWDRAYLKINLPLVDLTLGKQRIAWGTGYIWNPTDVFNPFTLSFAVKEEQKRAVEAVRAEFPLGPTAGIDAFILTGSELDKSTKGLKVKTNIGIYDFSLNYVDLGLGDFQLGFDSVGELFGLGVRGEAALICPSGTERYFNYILGSNYTFENGWGVNIEYYSNGLGKRNKDDYDWAGLTDGEISQLAKDYFYFGISKLLNEITRISGSFILNANDLSFIFYPSYSRNIFPNIDLDLQALLVGGTEGSEYKPTAEQDSTGLLGSNLLILRLTYNF